MSDKPAFRKALIFTLRMEGGTSNHPNDPGGLTHAGVTQQSYNSFRKRHRLPARPVIESTATERAQLYFEDYWVASGCEELPTLLQLAQFDAAVQHGVRNAVCFLQQALYCSPVDGIFGSQTRQALAAAGPLYLPVLKRCLRARRRFYKRLTRSARFRVFRRGWLRRWKAVREQSRRMRQVLQRSR